MKKQISGGNYYSVEELAKDVFGDSVYITNITGVQGGDINDAHRVSLSSGDLIFVKDELDQ